MVDKSIEERIREIVRDEIEQSQNRKYGPRPNKPYEWPLDNIPTWPPKENKCVVCSRDLNEIDLYVCNHPNCPCKVQYILNEDKTNTGGGGTGV
jgi:hypothetical protein